ncbi:hypothetical protein AYO20_05225 [Fonsecaea nubica]|uniref:Uncharacterized protein n=1 Tax=Fonsecaea nubica TaxID=856822 RepID=A0A178D1K8_9EURO|nr:hypothetical protein AYO20_05225 [Fonsecaea nubica]OAL35606.1 hypothetical protein AYO20_05225 [Fonsecaea nubica]
MSPTKATQGPLAEKCPNPTSPAKTAAQDVTGKDKFKGAFADAGKGGIHMPRFEVPQQQQRHQIQTQNQPTCGAGTQTYISPSDAIRSPTTKKLSEIKGRRFMNAKPQTLFARTLAKENQKAQLAHSQTQAQAQAQAQAQDGIQH